MIDVVLYLTYFLFFAAILLVLGFAGWFLVKNFKKSKTTIFGFIGLIVLFVIAYFISSGEVYEKFQIGEGLSKLIGGSIITLYIMFFGTILAAIYAEISKMFK
ncbi:MAG TPA: hypothetical protein PLP65_11275 [Bacteroidales bacterium]|jgi:hypothetical protein|nr:hypothetical protein [Bacteroidales bacterium]HOU99415.1 hypothetical protein [Bacteroidales bacterium]